MTAAEENAVIAAAARRMLERLLGGALENGQRSLYEPLSAGIALDTVAWLASRSAERKLYWQSRDGQVEVAALEFASQLTGAQAQAWLEAPHAADVLGCWISGFPADDEGWSGFPRQLLVIPQLALKRERDCWQLLGYSDEGGSPALECALRKLINDTAEISLSTTELPTVSRTDSPSRRDWCRSVMNAQQRFSSTGLRKVVLARQTCLRGDDRFSFWQLFHNWQRSARNSYQMALQLSPQQGFISFSPERLFLRQQQQVYTEALAGTLIGDSGASIAVDAKNSHEHRLVIDDVRARLRRCCVNLTEDGAVRLLSQPEFQHLYLAFEGHLKPGIGDAELLTCLHPTAAIGGLPSVAAQNFIDEQEAFSRGWFAGVCGLVSASRTELAVGIRSARVTGCEVALFAGAGIVPASDPQQEWQELEQKIALPLAQFKVVDDTSGTARANHVFHHALHP